MFPLVSPQLENLTVFNVALWPYLITNLCPFPPIFSSLAASLSPCFLPLYMLPCTRFTVPLASTAPFNAILPSSSLFPLYWAPSQRPPVPCALCHFVCFPFTELSVYQHCFFFVFFRRHTGQTASGQWGDICWIWEIKSISLESLTPPLILWQWRCWSKKCYTCLKMIFFLSSLLKQNMPFHS